MLISSLTYPLCVDDCDQLGSQESSILKGTEINYNGVVSLYFFFFFLENDVFFCHSSRGDGLKKTKAV